MNWQAQWIKPAQDLGSKAPMFTRRFALDKPLTSAVLRLTGLGTYEAEINGQRVSEYVLAPGWTTYMHRLQVQTYDVTKMLSAQNELTVVLGKGWYRSPLMCHKDNTAQTLLMNSPAAITAELTLAYADGTTQTILTDENWQVSESPVRFSELYDGEVYDATFVPAEYASAVVCDTRQHFSMNVSRSASSGQLITLALPLQPSMPLTSGCPAAPNITIS